MASGLQRSPSNICSICTDIKGAVLVPGECSELSLLVFTSWEPKAVMLCGAAPTSMGRGRGSRTSLISSLWDFARSWQDHRDQTQLLMSLCLSLAWAICWNRQLGENHPVCSSAAHLSSLNESLHLLR